MRTIFRLSLLFATVILVACVSTGGGDWELLGRKEPPVERK